MPCLEPKTLLVVDELSLCTTWDFQNIILPMAKLGASLWLLGDCRNQLLSIGDTFHGATGLKTHALASILKMNIPELRFAGRPPNTISERKVAVAGPGAAPPA